MYIHIPMSNETKQIGRECIGFRVRMLNRMITAIYDDALASVGLKASQFNLLVVDMGLRPTRAAMKMRYMVGRWRRSE